MDSEVVNTRVAMISGVITALAAWVYCAATYGFLFGFGLGWLPSAILGGIVGFVMLFAWRVVLGILGLLVILIVWGAQH